MALTKTKIHRMLNDILDEGQERIVESAFTKSTQRKARAKMLSVLNEALIKAHAEVLDSTTPAAMIELN